MNPTELINKVWGLFVALFITDGRFIVLTAFLLVADLVSGVLWVEGRANPAKFKTLKNKCAFVLQWASGLAVLTAFGNTFVAFGWVIEFAYIVVSFRLVNSFFTNTTKPESDVRRMVLHIVEEVKRRNFNLAHTDEPFNLRNHNKTNEPVNV